MARPKSSDPGIPKTLTLPSSLNEELQEHVAEESKRVGKPISESEVLLTALILYLREEKDMARKKRGNLKVSGKAVLR